jgi:diacylglycerol kinase (ATP)
MRAAVIFGLGSSEKDLRPFQERSKTSWLIGLPASSAEADAILIFGGDGTVHRHLAQLARLQLPLLVVPCGSGNDFARALHLGDKKDSLAVWQKFESGDATARPIDLGVITPVVKPAGAGPFDSAQGRSAPHKPAPHHHYFCCVGGVGLDGEVARRANQLPRWLRGHGGYVLSFPPALFRFAPVPMKISTSTAEQPDTLVERSVRPTVLAAFANAPVYGGGMKIAPRARMDDGQLDICIITDIDKFKLFCLFPTVYFGKHLSMKEVEYFQAERLRIETERPLDVYADGEYVCQTPVEVRVAKGALPVIVEPGR